MNFYNLQIKGSSFQKINQPYNFPPVKYLLLLLIAIIAVVYWPVFSHDFQFAWDDQWVVMNDYTESGINIDNLWSILVEFYHGQYAPVNELFYLFLYSLFGYSAFWFHTASLLVHVANVLLLFFLLKKILLSSKDFKEKPATRIAFLTALLLATHPLMVESVAWMAASKCLLFTFFYLVSLHTYVRFLNTRSVWYFLATILMFAMSFGAKEQAVTLPICLVLLDYVFKRDLKKIDIWFEKLPFFCLSICFGIITFYSQAFNGEGLLSSSVQYPYYQNFVFAAYTVIEYAIKIILPLKLHYIYPFPNLPGEPLPAYLWAYPFLLVFLAITFRKFLRHKWILFGIGFFLIQISIVSNILPTARFAILADRYVYLPAVGIFFLISLYVNSLIERKVQLKYAIVLLIIYLACISIYTRRRSMVWHDSFTLKKELKENLRTRSDYKKFLDKQKALH